MASRHHPLIKKAADIIHKKFTKEELVELGDALDGGASDQFLDAINEHLMEDSPEVFGMPSEVGKPIEAKTAEAANDPRDD